jgi:hypothetical protein
MRYATLLDESRSWHGKRRRNSCLKKHCKDLLRSPLSSWCGVIDIDHIGDFFKDGCHMIRFAFFDIGIRVIFFLLLAGFARSEPNFGIQAQSFGGAFRSVANSNDIIFYNPAGIFKNRRVEIDADYHLFLDGPAHNFGASIIDSKTTSWGLGLAYKAQFHPRTKRVSNHRGYLTVGMPLIKDVFFLGSSVNYLYATDSSADSYRHFFNIDLGVMAILPFGFSFSATLDHLLKPKGPEKDMGLAFAAALDLKAASLMLPLTLSFDWLMDDVKNKTNLNHILGYGLQYVLLEVLPLRIGLKSKLKDSRHAISFGVGLNASMFGIDGVYQQDLKVSHLRSFGVAIRFLL